MTTLYLQGNVLIILCLAVLAVQLLHGRRTAADPQKDRVSDDCLYRMARITGHGEYEIFCKSAEDWPVSRTMVDRHFKDDLLHQTTPCYVNAFLRKHRQQVDDLKMPPF